MAAATTAGTHLPDRDDRCSVLAAKMQGRGQPSSCATLALSRGGPRRGPMRPQVPRASWSGCGGAVTFRAVVRGAEPKGRGVVEHHDSQHEGPRGGWAEVCRVLLTEEATCRDRHLRMDLLRALTAPMTICRWQRQELAPYVACIPRLNWLVACVRWQLRRRRR